jgi:hypothetical protein
MVLTVGIDRDNDRRLEEIYVVPFYFHVDESAASISALGKAAPLQDILDLLASQAWRSRKMGAWFSLVREEEVVRAAVIASLKTSRGRLTSLDLAVAAVTLVGSTAIPALLEYRAADIEQGWGAAEWIDEVIDWLRHGAEPIEQSETKRSSFPRLMKVGKRIRDSDTSIKASLPGRLSLRPWSTGQTAVRLPSRTLSLMLRPADSGPLIGCAVTRVDGRALNSGDNEVAVVYELWDESDRSRLRVGESLIIQYGHDVGRGDLADDEP